MPGLDVCFLQELQWGCFLLPIWLYFFTGYLQADTCTPVGSGCSAPAPDDLTLWNPVNMNPVWIRCNNNISESHHCQKYRNPVKRLLLSATKQTPFFAARNWEKINFVRHFNLCGSSLQKSTNPDEADWWRNEVPTTFLLFLLPQDMFDHQHSWSKEECSLLSITAHNPEFTVNQQSDHKKMRHFLHLMMSAVQDKNLGCTA